MITQYLFHGYLYLINTDLDIFANIFYRAPGRKLRREGLQSVDDGITRNYYGLLAVNYRLEIFFSIYGHARNAAASSAGD